MDGSSTRLDGEMVSNTATPPPDQTGGGIRFQETTPSTPTDGGALRKQIETIGKDGNKQMYGQTGPSRSQMPDNYHNGSYGLDNRTQAQGQQTTAKHRRAWSAPWLSTKTGTQEQNDLSSPILAQVKHSFVAEQVYPSSPIRLSPQLLRPVEDLQLNEESMENPENDMTQEADDELSLPDDGSLWSSPLAPLTPVKGPEVRVGSPVTHGQRSTTESSEATSTGTKAKQPLHRLQRELAAHNDDSKTKKLTEPELVQKVFRDAGTRMTRATIAAVACMAKGEAPPVRKSLALESLFPSSELTEERMQDEDLTSGSDVFVNTEPEVTDSDEDMDIEYDGSPRGRAKKVESRSRSTSDHQNSSKKSPHSEASLKKSSRMVHRSGVAGLGGFAESMSRLPIHTKNAARHSSSRLLELYATSEDILVAHTGRSRAPSPSGSPVDATRGWDKWENQKDRIVRIITSPGYSPATSGSHVTHAPPQPYQALSDIPAGYAWRMDCDIHVFEPTRSVFENFGAFLKVVEEIAGREVGVVKVVVPRPTVSPNQEDEKGNTQLLPTQRFGMTRVETTVETRVLYKVETNRYGFEVADLQAIENHSRTVSETWASVKDEGNQVWKEPSFGTTLREKSMLKRLTSGVLAATDLDESLELRKSLKIKDLQLSKLPGNRLLECSSTIPGVHSSKINVCHTEGVPLAMHCKRDATYSISYLHKGAPMCWTIVKPRCHQDLEGTVDILTRGVRSSRGLQKPHHSPLCDQFIGHQALYLPSTTLNELGMEWKQVVQHQNEMIITFPFAYRQAYSTGPNITEEISYASNRWDIFAKEDLYRQCLPNCPGGGPRMDLSFVKTSQRRLIGHKRTATGNPITPRKRSRGDRADSAASKETTTPRGDASGGISKTKRAASSSRNATRFRSTLTPRPDKEDMQEKATLDEVEKLFAKVK